MALFKKNIGAWLIMLPSLLLFSFFVWAPLIENIRLSLYHANGIEIIEFVGLKNYQLLLQHPNFWPAMRNTFSYIFWSLLIGFWAPILLASLLTEVVHLKGLFRTSIYLPNILPGLASVIMWGFFLRPGPTGVLNQLLAFIGVEHFTWLITPGWTIPLIVMTMTWKSAGATAFIYMAGISAIPAELYEAATIDGATPLNRFRHIMLPSILGLGKTLLILQIIAVFQILYEPLVLTNGGPNNASISIMLLVYKYAFEDYNYPMATALSVLICIILVILTLIYFRLTKKVNK